MCGVLAALSARKPIERQRLESALNALVHRGPDSSGIWLSPRRDVALGHRRLAIIDLSGGDQPIPNETGSAQIVVNGEFYDYQRIQRELEGHGHRLKTRSDSEILVHLYEDFGTRCLRDLRGEFAFVLWDEQNRQLMAGRDRFGIKPLFYAVHDETLYLASEIKALFAAGVPPAWDAESFLASTLIAIPNHRSLFRGVRQVPPGHYLLASVEGGRLELSLHRYWDLDYPKDEAPESTLGEAECVQQVRQSLEQAIELRLRADVPVGCLLSGGLDSSVVAGLAANRLGSKVRMFHVTLGDDNVLPDEEPLATETARWLGVTLDALRVDHDALAEVLPQAVWHAEAPHLDLQMLANFKLFKMIRENGYKTVLSGFGSDEVFAGYASFAQDHVHYGLPPAEAARFKAPEARVLTAPPDWLHQGDHPALDTIRRVVGFVPAFIERNTPRAALYRSLFSSDFSSSYSGMSLDRAFVNTLDADGQLLARPPLHQSMYLYAKTVLPDYHLASLGDRMEMANSVEGRLPFLDHVLFEVVKRMPVGSKVHLDSATGTTSQKHVLRQAAKPFVTEAVFSRKKQPFQMPPRLAGRLLDMARDAFASNAVLPFFDLPKLRQLTSDYVGGTKQHPLVGRVLLGVLQLSILQQRFNPAA